jgi:hypothetical protein
MQGIEKKWLLDGKLEGCKMMVVMEGVNVGLANPSPTTQ